MPRQSKKKVDIHQQALIDFDKIQTAMQDERNQCLEDRRFYSIAGAQWEGDLEDQFESKPKFEVNKVHLAVIRIINEYRNNRITVDFVAKDGAEDEMADVCDGRYRADEDDSGAQEAYDNAFEEAVSGGFGAWRLTTKLEDEEDDDGDEYQRVAFEPIFDADQCVFFDLGAKRQDKSDAKYCFVISSMTPEAFEDEFGESPRSWPVDEGQSEFDWNAPDLVYIAEYYLKEEVSDKIQIWQDLQEEETKYTPQDFDDDPQLFEMLTATGSRMIEEKKVKRFKIRKYLMSGGGILEDYGYIAGKCIPIVPVFGKRWYVNSIERCMGHVRLAKDAQRLKNMQLSKLGEISALSTIEKPLLTPEQVAGHQTMWSEDNIKNYPYLLINPVVDQNGNIQAGGPVGYTKPPQIPPAMAALLQITEQDMQDLLGNQQAGEEIQPNVSGKAIELIQNKLDMQTFIYMSNMAKAVKRSGEIWLSIGKEIYVEDDRKLKVLTPQKDVDSVELMQPAFNDESGEMEFKNDFTTAKFDLSVQVGPSTSSKKAATVRALTGMLQMTQDPQDQMIISAMALMNIEGEGLTDIHKFYRKKLLRSGAIEPNEQEAQELAAEQQAQAQQQQDGQQKYLQALAVESMAKAEKAQADTILTAAKAEETKAKTAETLSNMSLEERKHTIDTLRQIEEITNQEVTTPPIKEGEKVLNA